MFIPGAYYKRRAVVMYTLLLILLSMPWIPVGDTQAVLFDLAHRRFVFFGVSFWATDTRFLFLVLASAGLSLFFFTSLLGRVWCGWACPQTVFLEFVFRPIERLIEGNHTQRKRLDEKPWDSDKIIKKGTKYLVFTFISWILASTLLAYFVGRVPLIEMMTHLPTQNMTMFSLTIFVMALFLFEFGWFREQFCSVVCPYARFQSVLMDKDSLIVGYDKSRGEPRGKNDPDKGDCVDCGMCMRVCPNGIDVRNGTQLECIQCGACVDACTSVMVKLGKPTGLIRFDTERGIQEGIRKFLRPRIVAYGTLLSIILCLFVTLLLVRKQSEFLVIRMSQATPFQVLPDGQISNQFKVHIGNKSLKDRVYTVRVADDSKVTLVTPMSPFPVSAASGAMMPLFINFKNEDFNGKRVLIEVSDDEGVVGKQEVPILAPGK